MRFQPDNIPGVVVEAPLVAEAEGVGGAEVERFTVTVSQNVLSSWRRTLGGIH